ncbi:hypothetical protein ACWX0K_15060 [Nitrobacteraceae bacterium UC4446_H13]
MANTVRTLTTDDKVLLRAALLNAGVKARVATIRNGFRVVFEGAWQPVADALNNEGFRYAGGSTFGQFSNNGNETYVRFMAVA